MKRLRAAERKEVRRDNSASWCGLSAESRRKIGVEWRHSCEAGRQAHSHRKLSAESFGRGQGEGQGDRGLDNTLRRRLFPSQATKPITKTEWRVGVAGGWCDHAPLAPNHRKAGDNGWGRARSPKLGPLLASDHARRLLKQEAVAVDSPLGPYSSDERLEDFCRGCPVLMKI